MKFIKNVWAKYIQWCDAMGLTPENRRSCAPRLSEPELTSIKLRAEAQPSPLPEGAAKRELNGK
ncbi:hypothetical protein [Shewanella sp. MBTL60-007]|uniref:hypothetical protein n=1 Tax=Shewanella sp. MBTL60-007 TaxID=2815911 RepID=UPI001BB876D1|nr:hypothetical protein [Shewanella sp. MBTL60-007]GIU26615.1 hypothetical protein TUM3792_33550 [Shewanella sp. MBTL60-007]